MHNIIPILIFKIITHTNKVYSEVHHITVPGQLNSLSPFRNLFLLELVAILKAVCVWTCEFVRWPSRALQLLVGNLQ